MLCFSIMLAFISYTKNVKMLEIDPFPHWKNINLYKCSSLMKFVEFWFLGNLGNPQSCMQFLCTPGLKVNFPSKSLGKFSWENRLYMSSGKLFRGNFGYSCFSGFHFGFLCIFLCQKHSNLKLPTKLAPNCRESLL